MRITKYIFKITFINTLISTLVIMGIVWLSQSFRSIKFILEKGGGIFDFFQLSLLSVPSWLSISLSFGMFFGIFISYSKLENDKEIIAMKSSGLNGIQIALPGILISFLLSFILFLNLHFLSPASYTIFKNYQNEIRYRSPEISFNKKTFVDVDKYTTIFFENKTTQNKISNVFIQDRRNIIENVEIFAKEGIFFKRENKIYLVLKEGTKIFSPKNKAPTIIDFEMNTINLQEGDKRNKNFEFDNNTGIRSRFVESKELSFFDLLDKSKLDNEFKNQNKYLAEAHSRNVNSVLPLTFSMIVLSFLLLINNSIKNNILNKVIIFSLIFFIQTILIIFKNLTTKDIFFLPYLYSIPIFIIMLSYLLLRFETFFKNLNSKIWKYHA